MKRISKWIFLLFCTAGILLAASVACFASTYSSAKSVDYTNELYSQYASEVKVPFVRDTLQDGVDTSSGDLALTETDLTLPGKNGFDLTISRSFNSSTADTRYSYHKSQAFDYWPELYCYQYRSSNGNVYWIAFPSEETMLEKAPTSFQYAEPNMKECRLRQPDGSYIYPYMGISNLYDYEPVYTMTRIPNTFKKGDYERYLNRFYESDVDHDRFILNWELNLPQFRKVPVDNYSYSPYTEIMYYGEFRDGESTYTVEYTRRHNSKTGVYDIINSSVWGDALRKYSFEKNEQTDQIAADNNIGDYFCLQRSDGVMFYFNIVNGTLRGKADRFGNFISIRKSGLGYEIIDTMGRKVSITTDGIKVVENGTERWPVRYSVTHAPYAPEPILDTKTPYVLRVEKTEQYVAPPVTSVTTYDMYKRERLVPHTSSDFDSWPITYYEIRKITYPTGAYATYSYDTVRIIDGISSRYRIVPTKWIQKSKVSQSVIYNGSQSTVWQYTYNNEKEGMCYEKLSNSFRYRTTKKNLTDNVDHTYTFDRTERVRKYTASDITIPEIEYEYGTKRFGPPIKVTESIQRQYSKQRVTEAAYSDSLQCTWQKDGSYEMNATYNACDLLLTQTYKRDADTTIQIRNTESADKKTIIKSEILENDVVKSVTDYEYDSYGNLSRQTVYPSDGESSVTEFAYTYNADGTSSVTSAVKNVADADGANPADLSTTVRYDFWGNAAETTDARGNTTSVTYDALGRPLSQRFPDGTTTGAYYSTPNNYVEYTQQNGSKIKYQYDALGNLKALYLQQNGVYRKAADFSYDALGRKVSETEYRAYNAAGACTERYATAYTYDVRSRVTGMITRDIDNAVVFQKAFTYDETSSSAYNYVTQSITGDATITPAKLKSCYDVKGRLIAEQVLNGSEEYQKTVYTYDFLDNLLTAADDKARDNNKPFTVRYEYDYANRPISETDIDGNVARTAYDAAGRKISDTDKLGNTANYYYDAAGRLVKATAPLDDTQTSETKTYYDANGNVIKTLTAAGNGLWNAQTTEYDAMNRPVTVKGYLEAVSGPDLSNAPSEVSATYTYNAMGSVLTQAGASGQSFAYNDLNQPVTITDAEGNSETYEYSLLGLPLKKTDRKGVVTSYTYNVWKSPLSISASYGGETQSVSYTYDMLGNRKSMTDAGGTTTYNYDFLSRLTSETRGDTMKTYEWDRYGNKTGVTVDLPNAASAYTANYTYDLLGRITAMTGFGSVTGSYGYDANGRMTSQALGGISTSYTYQPGGMVAELESKQASNNTSLYHATYGHDRGGNLVQEAATGKEVSSQKQYAYDGKNRLKTEEINAGSGDLVKTQAFTYDSHENVESKHVTGSIPEVPTGYFENNSFLGNNKLVEQIIGNSTGTGSVTKTAAYDSNGNMTENLEGAALEYDLFNRLVKYTKDSNVYTYTYDGDGRRTSKTVNGKTTQFVWDGMNMIIEYAGADDVSGYYYGPKGVDFQKHGSRVVAYGKNALGDVIGTYDVTSGVVLQKEYCYDAYGNPISQSQDVPSGSGQTFQTIQDEIDETNQPMEAADIFEEAEPTSSPVPINPLGDQEQASVASANAITIIGKDNSEGVVYISDLEWVSEVNGWGPAERDLSNGGTGRNDGGPIRINDVQFEKGLGCHAYSDIRVALNGEYERFQSYIGVDDNAPSYAGSVIFRVYGDDTLLYESGVLRGSDDAVQINIPVPDVQTLRLEIYETADGKNSDGGDWGDAKLILKGTEPAPEPGEAVHNPFGYRGEYMDDETGLIYLRARYYDPKMGRFINEDPIKDGLNWYVYCSGNPVMYVDPSGLNWKESDKELSKSGQTLIKFYDQEYDENASSGSDIVSSMVNFVFRMYYNLMQSSIRIMDNANLTVGDKLDYPIYNQYDVPNGNGSNLCWATDAAMDASYELGDTINRNLTIAQNVARAEKALDPTNSKYYNIPRKWENTTNMGFGTSRSKMQIGRPMTKEEIQNSIENNKSFSVLYGEYDSNGNWSGHWVLGTGYATAPGHPFLVVSIDPAGGVERIQTYDQFKGNYVGDESPWRPWAESAF